jgi:AcrR family transcriptional regulator
VSRREHTKAANRAALVTAGREAFSELGYDAVGVRDIVRRTDLASGTFYNYFPDKPALFRAVVEEVGAEARRRVRAARREATDARSFVRDGFAAFFEFIASEPKAFGFLARNFDTIRQHFGDAVLPAGLGELREDLEDAIARGLFPPVDVDYCAHAMVAVGLELGGRLLARQPPDIPGATAFATALFADGLAPDARTHSSRPL